MFQRLWSSSPQHFIGEPITSRRQQRALAELITEPSSKNTVISSDTRNHVGEPWVTVRSRADRLDILICWTLNVESDPTRNRSFYSFPFPLPAQGSLPLLSDGKRVVRFSRVPEKSGAGPGLGIEIGDLALNRPGIIGISDPFERLTIATAPSGEISLRKEVLRTEEPETENEIDLAKAILRRPPRTADSAQT